MPSPEKPFQWLAGAAQRPAFWLGLPLLLYVWTLTGPFVFDDLHLVLKAERFLAGETTEPGLFRFARNQEEWLSLRDRGTAPWWAPAAQRVDPFRPMSEWSFCLDMWLFGRHPLGHRLVSLAWFVSALLGVRWLFKVAGGDAARAGLATFFCGISQTLTQPVTFICNRSDLLVIVGTTLAAGAYWSATSRRKRWVLLAAAAYAFALLSKEIAVGLAVVVLVHEVLRRHRRSLVLGGVRPDGKLPAWIAVSFGGMAAAYVAYYAVTRPWHFGLGGNDALNNISVLANAPRALPLYLAVWTTGFPISVLLQSGIWPVLAVGAAGLVGVAIAAYYWRRNLRSEPADGFFLLWAVVFLGIALLTLPETRVLSLATIGWTYFLSGLLMPPKDQRSTAPRWLRHWLLAANGAVSICCAVATVLLQTHFERQCQNALNSYVAASELPLRDGDTLIVDQPQSEIELLFAGDRLEFLTHRHDCGIAFLALPFGDARFRWIDDRTLDATTSGADLLGSPAQRFVLGRNWRPAIGWAFEHRVFTTVVSEVSDDGRVTALRFHFKEPITSPRLHYVSSDTATRPSRP